MSGELSGGDETIRYIQEVINTLGVAAGGQPGAESRGPEDFLAENEPLIQDFVTLAQGQLDHATLERGNDGNLNVPLNDECLYAAKWQTTPPVLPEHLRKLLPFKSDEPVVVHARYRYGSWSSMVNVWVSSIGDGEFRSFSLGLRVDPQTGEVQKSIMNRAGSDKTGKTDITEQDARSVMDAIFVGNDAYQAADESLDVASRFRLGIATQPDQGAELYTVEKGEKTFAVPSRTSDRIHRNGFSLSVSVTDRAHPGGKPSKTHVTLRRHFEPADYSPAGLYEGMLTQELIVEQDSNGRVTAISRDSKVQFFNEPAITKINDKETVVSMAGDAASDLPEELARQLYPDSTPTHEDLLYFARLISQPINEEDCYI